MAAATTMTLAIETDTQIAKLSRDRDGEIRTAMNAESTILRTAGAKYRYRGRQRVTDMTISEALPVVTAEIARMDAHRAANDGASGLWIGWEGSIQPYEQDQVKRAIEQREAALDAMHRLTGQMDTLEDVFRANGWSRFFLVTSSAGHIHSSMHCSSCRPTTTYGWLPDLSGSTEAEAVAIHGPNLCTVCFPSAPVVTQGGTMTARQAEEASRRSIAGEAPVVHEAKPAKVYCSGSGKGAADLDFRYHTPRGNCPDCKARGVATSTGKVRKHEAKS